ncbi:MAG: hypothetical protein QME40_03240 [bacterium]|nr:hypothetical protein [bacterium]
MGKLKKRKERRREREKKEWERKRYLDKRKRREDFLGFGLLYRIEEAIVEFYKKDEIYDLDVKLACKKVLQNIKGEREIEVSSKINGLVSELQKRTKEYVEMVEEELPFTQIILCFERILNSIDKHSKGEEGSKRYIDFISGFMRKWG